MDDFIPAKFYNLNALLKAITTGEDARVLFNNVTYTVSISRLLKYRYETNILIQ